MNSRITDMLPDNLKQDYWVTRENQILYPNQFADGHLVATIRMIERQVAPARGTLEFIAGLELVQSLRAMNADDGTSNAAMDEMMYAEHRTLEQWLYSIVPIYKGLYDEAQQRGLL
jgi:hypothetical protein